MIETKQLSFTWPDGREVLREISFASSAGSFIALLGNNGAGKSTLLKCMNGILATEKGSVLMDGCALQSMKRRDIARKMAYVEQSGGQSRLTVYDTVLMGRKPYIAHSVSGEDIAIVERVLDRMGLRSYAMRYVDELSGGERQKVFIARAMAQCPKILLMDEPTNNLDIYNQHEVMRIAAELVRLDGITVIAVLHDLNLALRYCDRFFFLKDGKGYRFGGTEIVDEGTIETVFGIRAKLVKDEGVPYVIPYPPEYAAVS